MGKCETIVGKKYGRLTVLKRVENKSSHARFICRCDCGTEKEFTGNRLGKKTNSCGCLSADLARERRLLPKGESAFNLLFATYKRTAEKRNLEFDIAKDYFLELVQKDCFYCGSEPSSVSKATNGNFIYNGVDRIDNSKGYVLGNVVSCCTKCNFIKGTMSLEELREHLNKIFKNWIMRIK